MGPTRCFQARQPPPALSPLATGLATRLGKELVWDGGVCSAGRALPVVFDASVNGSDIDEGHLQEVLRFNEEVRVRVREG